MCAKAQTWVRSMLEASGFSAWGVGGLITRLAGVIVISVALAFVNSHMLVFSICIGALTGALAIELLSARGAARQREISKFWPEVLDSFASAEAAGISIAEAFDDLAEHATASIKTNFVRASAKLQAGYSLDAVLDSLKAEVGSIYADRMFELLRVVNEFGSRQYHTLLRDQAKSLRSDLAMMAAVEAKQSWVLGIAKLAIAAPWLIVSLLASRTENREAYTSAAGGSLLTLGLFVSAFAYYLIYLLGSLPTQRRVLQ